MNEPKPDVDLDAIERYKTTVLEYLNENGCVASKDELRRHLNIPDWYITQIANYHTFYMSLDHDGAYVASKYLVGHRSDHQHVWLAEIEDGHAVFDRKESAKATRRSSCSTAHPARLRVKPPRCWTGTVTSHLPRSLPTT